MLYEALLREAEQQGIHTYEKPMGPRIKGLYADGVIWINKNLSTRAEKACVMAEELGHHNKTAGDILDQRDLVKRKLELIARSWGYERVVPLTSFIVAHRTGIRNRYELAEHLGVTEHFLDSCIKRYQEKYGTSVKLGMYTIVFDPLGVLELFE